jgi:peptidyl-prolyl cis-trans isomerase D
VRNELVLKQADSAKAMADTAEMSNLFLNFKNAVAQVWTQLSIEPSKLVDSTGKAGNKEALAGARVEEFFGKLIKNEVPLVDVPYPVARALQKKYDFSINDAGLDKVVEKAKTVRATSDSLKAGKGAPAAPAPGAAAPGAAAPAPTPDTTKK